MASYFQSYFQASSMPKRLLQYALSRLEILDTDALDLDNLDIAWGKNSTFEFKDVGLRLKKLETLLQLPPTICLLKARVLLLRLTIPVDIYSSPISVEVEGVDIQLRVQDKATHKPRTDHDRLRQKVLSKDPGATQSHRRTESETEDFDDAETDPTLPTAEDLAASFLQTESRKERAELEAAMLGETRDIAESVFSSDDGDSEVPVGTGTSLSLPAFMARFLQGIVDRLQVRVRGITFNVDVDIPTESPTPTRATDQVTVQMKVDDVDIEGVTHDIENATAREGKDISSLFKEGKRLICLSNIRGALISEANLFQTLSRSSSVISPAVTHTDFSERNSPEQSQTKSVASVRTFDGTVSPDILSSLPSRRSSKPPSPEIAPAASPLKASVVASENGRFDDASEYGNDSGISSRIHHDDDDDSEMGDSILQDSAFLDQISESQFLDDGEDQESQPSSPGLPAERKSLADSILRRSTPRASVHLSPSSSQLLLNDSNIAANVPKSRMHTMLQSTVLPPRPHTRFSDERVSHSQPSLRPEGKLTDMEISDHLPPPSLDADDLSPSASSASSVHMADDLTESQLFSHEDAESMYMSALSYTSSTGAQVPGGWADSSTDSEVAKSRPITPKLATQDDMRDNLEHARHSIPLDRPLESDPLAVSKMLPLASVSDLSKSTSTSRPATPRPRQPSLQQVPSNLSEDSSISEEYTRMTKQIFSLDQVAIYIPAMNNPAADPVDAVAESTLFGSTFDGQSDFTRSTMDLPGAFSTHLPRERAPRSPPKPTPRVSAPKATKLEEDKSIEIDAGDLLAQFDVSVGRLLYKLVCQVQESIKQEKKVATANKSSSKTTEPDLKISAKNISLKFLERLDGTLRSLPAEASKTTDTDVLLRTSLQGLNITRKSSDSLVKTGITLKKFFFGYAQENILSFNAGLQMRASVRDLAASAGIDVAIDIYQSPDSTRFDVQTLPLHVTIDLQRLDETFSWFGGLSSVLNLGSSMASNATVTSTPPIKPKPRGVRFDAPIKPDDKSVASQNKADVRIGGFILDLIGTECSVGVETSAIKLVSRDEGLGVAINKIRLSGPHLKRSNEDPAISVEISTTRIEFLSAPKDVDLDRLLALITPSKSKYDQDDDILLDTLLRQRAQGSVLRLTVDDVQARLGRLHELSYLPELGEEVSRLSTVAKYLPDDDRPGLLSLILLKNLDAHVDVNNGVGSVQLKTTDVEVAQITMPSLVAFSVSTISARRNHSEELVGPGTDVELRDSSSRAPAIMARLIGDEMEPIVRIKLWNLRVEYRVSTLITLLGLAEDTKRDDLSTSITASVATLRDLALPPTSKSAGKRAEKSQPPSTPPGKPMTIDVVLRDCIFGLNPLGLPSKILVVLTEAHVAAILPRERDAKATGELSKASLLVVDNVAHLSSSLPPKPKRLSFDGGSSQVADLCAMGYVSVSYISSAKANVVLSVDDDGQNCLDIELRDDLFVLESCADSTQTLINSLNKLAPPTAPSKETKYRTKVIPVKDLLASLTGDAFAPVEGKHDFDDDFGGPSGVGVVDDDELGFDSEYYKGDSEEAYSQAVMEDLDQSLASLNLKVRDTRDGVLLDSFEEEEEVDDQPLVFEENHFGTGSVIEGTAHRWNSARNTYDRSNESKVKKSPLKVCVRDVHIIWNLFDGYDWQATRDTISKAVQDVESKAIEKRARSERRPTFEQDIDDDEDTVIGDFLFNSIYIGIPANRDPRELAAAINQELNDNATETESIATTSYTTTLSRQGSGRRPKKLRLNRSKHHKITFELRGVCVDLVTFPPGSGETQSSVDVRVHDLEVFDHVPTSTWRKFATYMQDAGEREKGSNMVHIEILNVKPVPDLAASEIVLKATILPLRLHVDQDALDFITRFFEFKDDSEMGPPAPGEVPFLQRVEVNSVQVKLDFKPKRVDYAGLRSGHTTEFMNFLILDEADMVLRHTIIYGISGFDKMGKCLNDIWMPDIKQNQLPGILAGLAPVRSIVNVGGGFRDLVVVPMHEYKKDGRIVRSISKGAAAFAKTTGTELVKLGAKVAIGVQTVLQGAEDFLGPQPITSDLEGDEQEDERKQISLYANQPVGVLQGLKGGYTGLQRDLLLARDAIIAVPGEVMDGGSAAGVLRAVRKHAPTVILRPAIGVAKASGQVLMGATNSLDSKNLMRADAKYKKH
ncbi:atg c terminal domain-containing protein [Rutstroemia sp. NJR-2017a BVV2]|nr:atg c terminal domain-containing protein [Rutstroemia sp. NJR-2017a BVV2]